MPDETAAATRQEGQRPATPGGRQRLVGEVLDGIDWQPNGERVVVDIGDGGFGKNLPAKLLDPPPNISRRLAPLALIGPEPQLDLTGQSVALPLETVSPILEYASLLKPVSHRPRADVAQQREDIPPLRMAMLELLATLPCAPEAEELPKCLLVREHQVHAPAVTLVHALLVDEEIIVGWDVLLIVLGEELKPLDLRGRFEKVVHCSRRFENENIFGHQPGGSGLHREPLRLERDLELIETWPESLLLPCPPDGRRASSSSAFLRSGRGRRFGQYQQ